MEQLIHPLKLMRWIADQAPANCKIVADIGNSALWAQHALNETKNPTKLFVSWKFAAMGWGIGTALGLAFADPTKPIICITGDGSLLMNGQELTTVKEHNLPITFIILNDSSLGMVKHGQQLTSAANIANKLPLVNFAMLAHSYGIWAKQFTDLPKLPIKTGFPIVYDILIDPNIAPPIEKRIAQLQDSPCQNLTPETTS